MDEICIFPIGNTPACHFAGNFLNQAGIFTADHPRPEVTHLLLDVPSFDSAGQLRGGGNPETVLQMLPEDVTVIGGKLNHPALEGYEKIDLLRNEGYLAKNAAITADCALQVAAPMLETTFQDSPVLILGWGRIGKHLTSMLRALGAEVTVAARKESDRGMLASLGFRAVDFAEAAQLVADCRLIFNTVPKQVLECRVPESCAAVDLASCPGLIGNKVVWARGLPGKYAPESSGRLIADTVLKEVLA